MKKLDEIKSFASCLGDMIHEEHLACVSSGPEAAEEPYEGSLQYTISSTRLCSDDMEQLRIKRPLIDYWHTQNIRLYVYLFVENTRLIGGQIHKYKTVEYEDGESNYYELEPTYHEIKIVRRLLKYILREEQNMNRHTDSSINTILGKYLTVFGKCYSTGSFDELLPLLAEDAVLESQWIPEAKTGKAAVVDYFTKKGKMLREQRCRPYSQMIRLIWEGNKPEHAEPDRNREEAVQSSMPICCPDGKYAMILTQTCDGITNEVLVDLTLDETNLIAGIDLSMPELFPYEVMQRIESEGDTETESEETEAPDDEEIEAYLRELLSAAPEVFAEIEEYISEVEECYSGDISEFAFREAIRCGAVNYVEAYAGEFDLNDGGGYSTYLQETEDPDMQEILMDHGAFKSWDDYDECRFAMETVNGEILDFYGKFQAEVFKKYLEYTGLTKEKIIRMLAEGYDPEEDEDLLENLDRFFEEDFEAMGIAVKEGDIVFLDLVGNDGYSTMELLEELGWDCSFEGDSWKLETLGVYFIP